MNPVLGLVQRHRMSLNLVLFVAVIIIAMMAQIANVTGDLASTLREARIGRAVTAVEAAHAIVARFHAMSGEIGENEAKARALAAIRSLRFSGENYVWINDTQLRMIMHPFSPKLEGQDLSTMADPTGKKLFVEMRDVVRRNGGAGMVDYLWPRPGGTEPAAKVSFVKEFGPWNWILGAGVYVDDVRSESTKFITPHLATFAATVVVIVLLCIWVMRSTNGPIMALVRAMGALSRGDRSVAVEAAHLQRADLIGEMAKAIEVFRANAEEVERMTEERERQREQHESERRAALIGMADNIEGQTSAVVAHVAAETVRILDAAERMAEGAKRVEQSSQFVASAAAQNLSNAETVAGAAEELSASIREIASQVARTKQMVEAAVGASDDASETVAGLAEAMAAIDQVVQVILNISAQTNLLALNATIEAARAGDAGKGFAVVAQEVKLLANQTAREADGISQRMATLKSMAEQVNRGISDTAARIQEVEAIAGSVAAAVEQQDAATKEIAYNVEQSARAARAVSDHIGEVAREAATAGGQAAAMEAMTDAMAEKVTRLGSILTQVGRTTAPEVDRRVAPRMTVQAKARLDMGGRSLDCALVDMSVGGARVTGIAEVVSGDAVLSAGSLRIPVVVVKQRDDSVHLKFTADNDVQVESWLRAQAA